MTTTAASPDDHFASDDASRHSFSPGIVAGAVLCAARLSTGLTEGEMAHVAGIREETLRAWEAGSTALASATGAETEQLKDALNRAGAEPQLVADLEAAAWCDIFLAVICDQEDPTYVLNDPIASEQKFRELLAWAIGGEVPERYSEYFEPWPLLAR